MTELYKNTTKRLLKTENKRISEEAINKLRKELETHAEQIRERSVQLSDHAERTTIQGKDVEEAINQIKQ